MHVCFHERVAHAKAHEFFIYFWCSTRGILQVLLPFHLAEMDGFLQWPQATLLKRAINRKKGTEVSSISFSCFWCSLVQLEDLCI